MSAKSESILSPNDHQLSRIYKSIRLDLDQIDPSQLLLDISAFGEHFTEVYMKIRYYPYRETSFVMNCVINFLKTCINVRILSITSDFVKSIEQSKTAIEPFHLKKLHAFHVQGCSWVFKSVRCEELHALTIDYRHNIKESLSNVEDLIEVLKDLNRLGIVNLYNVNFSSRKVLKLKFKWNEMSLRSSFVTTMRPLYTTRSNLEEEKEI